MGKSFDLGVLQTCAAFDSQLYRALTAGTPKPKSCLWASSVSSAKWDDCGSTGSGLSEHSTSRNAKGQGLLARQLNIFITK